MASSGGERGKRNEVQKKGRGESEGGASTYWEYMSPVSNSSAIGGERIRRVGS